MNRLLVSRSNLQVRDSDRRCESVLVSYSFGTNRQKCSYTTVAPSKTIPDSRPKWTKSITVFRPKQRKTIPNFGSTTQYNMSRKTIRFILAVSAEHHIYNNTWYNNLATWTGFGGRKEMFNLLKAKSIHFLNARWYIFVVAGALADKTDVWNLEVRLCRYGSWKVSVSF